MYAILAVLLAASASAKVYLKEKFDDADWESRWTKGEPKSSSEVRPAHPSAPRLRIRKRRPARA